MFICIELIDDRDRFIHASFGIANWQLLTRFSIQKIDVAFWSKQCLSSGELAPFVLLVIYEDHYKYPIQLFFFAILCITLFTIDYEFHNLLDNILILLFKTP